VTFTRTKKVTEKVGESLSKNQKLIVKSMLENSNVLAKDLSDIIGISQRKIEENILKLKKKRSFKKNRPCKRRTLGSS